MDAGRNGQEQVRPAHNGIASEMFGQNVPCKVQNNGSSTVQGRRSAFVPEFARCLNRRQLDAYDNLTHVPQKGRPTGDRCVHTR